MKKLTLVLALCAGPAFADPDTASSADAARAERDARIATASENVKETMKASVLLLAILAELSG